MQTRVRHIVHKRKGTVVQNEQLFSKPVLTIGRSTDQDIFLSDLGVAYRHARLTISANGQVGVSSLSNAGVYVNGRFAQSGSLKGRGEVLIGPYKIIIEQGEAPVDIDIVVEQVAEDIVEVQSENMPALTLDQTWLSRRRGAWVGLLLVLILFLGLPLAGFFNPDTGEVLRAVPVLPSDGAWLSGEISAPHRHFADDCNVCHKKPFEKVPDVACVACHKSTTEHADHELFDLDELSGTRCASCHKEHSGNAFLTRQDQDLCSDCHGNLRRKVDTRLADIEDFGKRHVEFRPLLLTRLNPARDDKAAWQRVGLEENNLKHETGMVFPHDVHLETNGVESPTGNRVLGCSDCHQTDAGGNYMLPIKMEIHCQECHRLDFDQNTPDRQLPHADLKTLTSMLNEYYAYVALQGNYQDDEIPAPDIVRMRRIPGKELTPMQTRTALAWAQEKAANVKEEVIEFRSCNLCHKVLRDATAESGWTLPAVYTSQRWFTKGDFDHRSHRSTPCADCHDARDSKRSEDVLLPGIEVCRDCHAGGDSNDKLASGCIMCHQFHLPGNLLLGDREKAAHP